MTNENTFSAKRRGVVPIAAFTAWHSHPAGQSLIVTSGVGRVRQWGGGIQEIRAGVKHWHGAAPTTALTHIAIQKEVDGKAVQWLEHVTEEQFKGE